MRASVGDRLVIKGHVVGEPGRDAEILEVRGAGGTPPFVVRWSDSGHETLFFPGPDAEVQHFGTEPIVVSSGPTAATMVHEQHHHLLAGIQRLLDAADALDHGGDLLPDEVHEAYAFVSGELHPHLRVEVDRLYPLVEARLGSWAVRPMRRQLAEVDRLIDRLGRLRAEATGGVSATLRRNVRQVLHALHAILALHLASEEELFVPALEGELAPEDGVALVAGLQPTGNPLPAAVTR